MNRLATVLVLTLCATALAGGPDAFTVENLPAAVAADSSLVGREIAVTGQLVADFFREIYLQAPRPAIWPDETVGLEIRTGEHLGELGDEVRVRGVLEAEGGILSLRAEALDVVGHVKDLPIRRLVAVDELLESPRSFAGRMVEIREPRVARILRDPLGVPWLLVAETPGGRVDVELSDGNHPVLHEDMILRALRGIWRKVGDRWRLSPRYRADFVMPPAGDPCAGARRSWEMGEAPLLLDEICYDGAQPGEGEGAESFALLNLSGEDRDLSGWSVSDGEGDWSFPEGATIPAGGRVVVARQKERYFFEFGRDCDFSFDRDDDPRSDCLVLANEGDELLLVDPEGRLIDAVIFGLGRSPDVRAWKGKGAEPYRFSVWTPKEGAVLLRKRVGGRPLDENRAADWIGDPMDPVLGRQLSFAGWDRDLFAETALCREVAEVSAYVSPEQSFEGVRDFLRSARESLEIEIYMITHPLIVDELLAALDRGVTVTVLLDGELFGARGGTYDSVRGLMRKIVEHPSGRGRVYFWMNGDDPRHLGPDADVPDRYNHVHQKFVLSDRRRLLVGSDNFTQSSLPADDKSDGTGGSRGVFLATDASCAVERAVAIWEADCDPDRHRDIRLFLPHPKLPESLPRLSGNRDAYEALHEVPYSAREEASFELVQSPETFLLPDAGYLGLVAKAGPGDLVCVEQQYERPHWGYGRQRTENPRLTAYVDAARRGATVRILLSGNRPAAKSEKTQEDLVALAIAEGLDLQVRLGWMPRGPKRRDPIHNKMLLVSAGDERWSHVGSANGSETASRCNRELGLSVESAGLYDYLREVFEADWERAGTDK